MDVMNIHDSIIWNLLVSNRGGSVMTINSEGEEQTLHEVTGTGAQDFYHDFHYNYTHSSEEVPVDVHETE
jgi:hypothetical protein